VKKLLYMVLVITLLTFPFFGSCGEEEPTEVIELTYSNFFPPSHLHSVLVDQFCQEIEERTDGWVKITHYPGGSLTPAAGVYDGVVEGISDIGMSVLAYNMGRFPTTELVDLPHGYPSGWVASKVANDYYILGIPVMILLNAKTKEIIALPESAEQLDKLISL